MSGRVCPTCNGQGNAGRCGTCGYDRVKTQAFLRKMFTPEERAPVAGQPDRDAVGTLPSHPSQDRRGGDHGSEWDAQCLKWHGRLLTGKYGPWCDAWDGLPVDETTGEWPCECYRDRLGAALPLSDEDPTPAPASSGGIVFGLDYVVGKLRAEAVAYDVAEGGEPECRWCRCDLGDDGGHFDDCAVSVVEAIVDEQNACDAVAAQNGWSAPVPGQGQEGKEPSTPGVTSKPGGTE